MTVTVGINGFGRIGRSTLAHIAESARNDVQVVKINATGPVETNAHLLRYDSVHGRFPGTVTVAGNTIDLGRGPMDVMSSYDPAALDWSGCDVVLECTGAYNNGLKCINHTINGARKVVISAPAKECKRTVVYGVNHTDIERTEHVVSNASCTTNCLAPLVKVLDEAFTIVNGQMTTIHSYTGDQATIDKKHKDPYRARAGGVNIIPTSTGAASALKLVYPKMTGKIKISKIASTACSIFKCSMYFGLPFIGFSM